MARPARLRLVPDTSRTAGHPTGCARRKLKGLWVLGHERTARRPGLLLAALSPILPAMHVPLYDTHCHLHDAVFDADRDLAVERARLHGVRRVLAVAENLEDAYRLLDLAPRYRGFIVPAVGLHPDRVAETGDGEVAALTDLIRERHAELGAVGEVGLDFRPCWDGRARARQREVFAAMIAVSLEVGLPLTVHSRSAGHHAVTALREAGAKRACLHAFDGRAAHAVVGAEAGYHFSIPPAIVRSGGWRKIVRRLALDNLVLETDSPVLGPVPAERNEPAHLVTSLRAIARETGREEVEVARSVERNTERLFPRLVHGVDDADR